MLWVRFVRLQMPQEEEEEERLFHVRPEDDRSVQCIYYNEKVLRFALDQKMIKAYRVYNYYNEELLRNYDLKI